MSHIGTYNNQYMVLDLKKVKLQKSLDDGALYIIEQIPTLVEYSDQTSVLRKGNSCSSPAWGSNLFLPAGGGLSFVPGEGLFNTGLKALCGHPSVARSVMCLLLLYPVAELG